MFEDFFFVKRSNFFAEIFQKFWSLLERERTRVRERERERWDDSSFDQTDWQAHNLSKINYDAKPELEPLGTILIFELDESVAISKGAWRGQVQEASSALRRAMKMPSFAAFAFSYSVKTIFENSHWTQLVLKLLEVKLKV